MKEKDPKTDLSKILNFNRPFDLRAHSNISVPGKIKKGELDQKTIPHHQMAKYDHSLEMNRWKGEQ